MQVALSEAEARAAKVEKLLGEAKAKVIEDEVKFSDAKARTLVVEEELGEANNQVSFIKKVAQVIEVARASKVAMEAVKAFKVREEYCQKVLVFARTPSCKASSCKRHRLLSCFLMWMSRS